VDSFLWRCLYELLSLRMRRTGICYDNEKCMMEKCVEEVDLGSCRGYECARRSLPDMIKRSGNMQVTCFDLPLIFSDSLY